MPLPLDSLPDLDDLDLIRAQPVAKGAQAAQLVPVDGRASGHAAGHQRLPAMDSSPSRSWWTSSNPQAMSGPSSRSSRTRVAVAGGLSGRGGIIPGMAEDAPRLPLTPAQRRTAAELPWYRAWLLSTSRVEAELEADGEDLAASEQ